MFELGCDVYVTSVKKYCKYEGYYYHLVDGGPGRGIKYYQFNDGGHRFSIEHDHLDTLVDLNLRIGDKVKMIYDVFDDDGDGVIDIVGLAEGYGIKLNNGKYIYRTRYEIELLKQQEDYILMEM